MKKHLFYFLALLSFTGVIRATPYHDMYSGQLYYELYNYNAYGFIPEATLVAPESGNYCNLSSPPSGHLSIPLSVNSGGIEFYVVRIRGGVFRDCSRLTSVSIPSRVTDIEYNPFINCSGLTSITVNSSNTAYDSRNNCNAIIKTATNTLISGCQNTIIPNSVTSIGPSSFKGCSGLTSITIPNSVTSIGQSAFAYCSSLTSVKVLSSIPPSIESAVFAHTPTNLIIEIPCGSLAAYQQAWGTDYNFSEFYPDYTVTLQTNNTDWGTAAIQLQSGREIECDGTAIISATANAGYHFVSWNDGNTDNPRIVTVTGDASYTAQFDCLPSTGDTTAVACDSFTWWNTNYTNSTNTPTHTYTNAAGCDSVVTLNLTVNHPAHQALTESTCGAYIWNNTEYTVTGDYTFSHPDANNCTQVDTLHLTLSHPEFAITLLVNSPVMGSAAIQQQNGHEIACNGTAIIYATANAGYHFVSWNDGNTDNPRTVIVTSDTTLTAIFFEESAPDSLIYSDATKTVVTGYIQGLKHAVIPNTVTRIENRAFRNCSTMTSITIPNSVTSIGIHAFVGCSGLTSVTIPNSVTSIENHAFMNCSGLTSVTIPNSVTTIEDYAFYNCTGLTDVTIPNSVTSIGFNPFAGCSSLSNISIANGNTTYDSRNACNAIIETATNTLVICCKNSVIPNSVTSIGKSAFSGSIGLTNITIPDQVTSIGPSAFKNCSGLIGITIPSLVTSIGDHAFENCSSLTSVRLESSTPPILDYTAFYHTLTYNIVLEIPCGSLEAYQQAWGTSYNYAEHAAEYNITVTSNNEEWGSADYSITDCATHTIELTATANDGYHFVQWQDGNTDNPRTVNVTTDVTYTAQFDCLPSTGDTTAVACDSFTWWNTNYTNSTNTPTHTYVNAAGCDSTVTLHLTVNHPQHEAFSVTAFENYTWNNTSYTTSGDYTFSHADANNCMQVDTLHLTITSLTSGDWIDLGLPSGLLWASSNLASFPNYYAAYYAWGETSSKSDYSWYRYTYSSGSTNNLTKYCNKSNYGLTDNLTTLLATDDAATAHLGNGARIPTATEWQELMDNTTSTWTSINGVYGRLFTGSNGNNIFLPANGYGTNGGATGDVGLSGLYWSSSLYTDSPDYAWSFHCHSNGQYISCTSRQFGLSVRAVRPVSQNTDCTGLATSGDENITACDSYTWSLNGETYTATTTATHTLAGANAAGCDSTVTLHLTINHPQHEAFTVTACDSFTWNNSEYTESGDYLFGHADVNNCQQVDTLHLTVNFPTHEAFTETACESFTWNNAEYTQSGDYIYSHTDANNCTQVDTLHLTVYHNGSSHVYVTNCGPYTWEVTGKTYNKNGEKTQKTIWADGCITRDTLTLVVVDKYSNYEQVTICGPYFWDVTGKTYNKSGVKTYKSYAADGCPVYDTLSLTVVSRWTSHEYVTNCGPYTWDVTGKTYNKSGTKYFKGTSADGCPKYDTLTLVVTDKLVSHEYVTHCGPYTWDVTGRTYNQSGTKYYKGTTPEGCPIRDTLTLTIVDHFSSHDYVTNCGPYTWAANGKTYNKSGTKFYKGTTPEGCPVRDTLTLVIGNSHFSHEYVTTCGPYTWDVTGKTYNKSGTKYYKGTTPEGCPIRDTLTLVVNPITTGDTFATATGRFVWYGNLYTSSTEAMRLFTDQHGCDSIVTLHLTITGKGNSNQNANLSPLTSNLSIYPNPTTGLVHIEASQVERVEIIDLVGRRVALFENTADLDLTGLADGTYTLRITMPDGVVVRKVVKK